VTSVQTAQLEAVRAELRAQADPVFRDGVRRYFQDTVEAYGVRTPAIRKMASTIFREIRHWPLPARNGFCTELWKSGKLEEGSLAVVLYKRFSRECGACEFHLFEKWIDRFVHNWAHCDGLSTMLIAAAIANEPALVKLLRPWTAATNRWKRRAAAVSFIREARKGRHTSEIFEVAAALVEDPDDMVRKGVGWLLKDAYPATPREVMAFLKPRAATTPRLVLRIAAEKMTAADRVALLGRS
jgi:3-methyladenine DNA glycosylase AlkD